MNYKAINELIERAKKDPKFFHSLVFEPEKVLGSLCLSGEHGNSHKKINENFLIFI